LHCSTRIIAAAAVTGLVIEAMRKIVSRRIGASLSSDWWPKVTTCVSSRRLTRATMPGTPLGDTWAASASCKHANRVLDKAPTLNSPEGWS
jgi:hypothetical protein